MLFQNYQLHVVIKKLNVTENVHKLSDFDLDYVWPQYNATCYASRDIINLLREFRPCDIISLYFVQFSICN